MRPAIYKIPILAYLALSLSSCNYTYKGSNLIFPKDSHAGMSFGKLGFESNGAVGQFGVVDGKGINNEYQQSLIIAEENYHKKGQWRGEYDFVQIVDLRLYNGWNNWLALQVGGSSYLSRFNIGEELEKRDINILNNTDIKHYRVDFRIMESSCSSPPAYLHLVLDSLDDFKNDNPIIDANLRNAKGKRWVVDKILDINGTDVTNHPDWDCYNDNIYTFLKRSVVRYETGPKTCDVDQALEDLGLQKVFQSYKITPERLDFNNPGKISMTFKAPPGNNLGLEDYKVEIMSSDYNSAVFRISNKNGGQADLHLIPEEG